MKIRQKIIYRKTVESENDKIKVDVDVLDMDCRQLTLKVFIWVWERPSEFWALKYILGKFRFILKFRFNNTSFINTTAGF